MAVFGSLRETKVVGNTESFVDQLASLHATSCGHWTKPVDVILND